MQDVSFSGEVDVEIDSESIPACAPAHPPRGAPFTAGKPSRPITNEEQERSRADFSRALALLRAP